MLTDVVHLTSWTREEARRHLHAVLNAKDGNYQRVTNRKMIEMLDITMEEQRGLQVIIGPEVKRERDRARKQQKRRESGKMFRKDYEERARQRREEAIRLHGEGLSCKQIAQVLQVKERQVRNYLKTTKKNV